MSTQRSAAAGVGCVQQSRLTVASEQEMLALGAQLAALVRQGDLLVLTGDLGAGKTTLVRGLGAALDVRGAVSSPTFVIARVHPAQGEGPALVHVDAYRLSSLAEVDDLDLDASAEESVTAVEWGQGLVEDLAPDRLEVALRRPRGEADGAGGEGPGGNQPRAVTLRGFGERWRAVALPGAPG